MSTIARLTLAEYDRMIAAGVFDDREGRRLELIRGELREMTPAGTEHEDLIGWLDDWSHAVVPPDRVGIRIEKSVDLGDQQSVPEPDVAWVVKRNYRHARPTVTDVLLIIEVADSIMEYDRGEGASLYVEAGIVDYWIVNNPQQCIEMYREPEGGRYRSVQVFRREEEVRPLALPEAVLRASMLWPAGT